MRITVVGAGYAGLVTAACLADFGHEVTCADVDADRIAALAAGRTPFYEPGLDEIIGRNAALGRLRFTTDVGPSCTASAVVFVVVGTPSRVDGTVELGQLHAVVGDIAPHLDPHAVVVVKSTVPVGTTRDVAGRLGALRPDAAFGMASNPEFLRQGTAVRDFLHPDRVVVGTDDPAVEATMRRIYRPVIDAGVPFVATNPETAELIKYASNAFLALKLSFINEVADLCEATGARIEDVSRGIGLDARIAPGYLIAGPGYGGSCLPKDTQALLHTIAEFGTGSQVVRAALEVNLRRRRNNVRRVTAALGRSVQGATVAVLGVTFKADTDDIRESPAVDLIAGLLADGARVRVVDPQGSVVAAPVLPGAEFADSVAEAAAGADVLVIATEWREFATLDMAAVVATMQSPIVVDLRNLYDPEEMQALGIAYHSIGRPSRPASQTGAAAR